ncbi:MAG: YeeE/YedE family protein [Candidatus Nanohaloarchaea archaeon]
MIETLFPNGIASYALGGLLIGTGVSFIYLMTSRIPGASTFLESTLSYISDNERVQSYRESRNWRMIFTLGIVGGAFLHTYLFTPGFWSTDVSVLRLFIGGILVGIGTRLGKGCTSGHGVNGLGSLSKTSMAGVATFLISAILAAQTMTAFGVTP